MNSQINKRSLVWGGLLILFGIMSLLDQFVELGPWTWAVVLAAGGLVIFAVFLTDRSAWGLLIPAYVLWAVAGLIALIEFDILLDEGIATFVLAAVALPFLVTYLRDRVNSWALVPAYILVVVGIMVSLEGSGILEDEYTATFILAAIGLPFLFAYLRDRENWWALIPAYTLFVVGIMVGLIGADVLDDLLIPAYIMFAIALPFFIVYLRNRELWWALVPGVILGVIGLGFLIAEESVEYVGPVVLIILGVWILSRQFSKK